jgi:hypothetical protein
MREEEKQNIVWGSFDNYDASRTLKEHAYKNRTIKHWYEDYIGATSLCDSKKGVSEDGESFLKTENIEGFETPSMRNTCKKCLNIWNNLTNKTNE